MNQSPLFDMVLVGFRPADIRASLRFCERLCNASRGGRRLLVMNRPGLVQEIAPLAQGWDVMEGSNRLAEFSGWQEGLDRLRADQFGERAVVFVNDSVCTHRHFTLARAEAFLRALKDSQRPTLVGFRDMPYSEDQTKLTIAGLEFGAWTSTYCFALTAGALPALRYELYDSELVHTCVVGGPSEENFFNHLSPDLEAHLRHWLFMGGWYRSERLSIENAGHLTLKARCIAAEMLLSARCQSFGIEARDPFRFHPRLEKIDRLQRRLRREWLALFSPQLRIDARSVH